MNEVQKIAAILNDEPEWFVICHVKPDGDTLGSGSALVSAGKNFGKRVLWGGADPFPPQYKFLPHSDEYMCGSKAPRCGPCVIAIDVSTRERGLPNMGVRVAIDHHADNDMFGRDANWVVPEAAAVGELIYELLVTMNCPLDKNIAEALYVAILTDCGGFRFSNTRSETLRIASELVAAGAVPAEIDEKLYYNDTPEKLHLWARCLSRAEKIGSNSIISWLTRDDFRQTGAPESDTEGLVNMLTRVGGVSMTILAYEEHDAVRCSVRARGQFSAQEIAARHDGGGHRYAAGCKLRLPLEEAISVLKEELSRV